MGIFLKKMDNFKKEIFSSKEKEDPSKEMIDKLDELMDTLGAIFISAKKPPNRRESPKVIYVPKVPQPHSQFSSSGKAELKTISEHPVDSKLKKEVPIYNTRVHDFMPISVIIRRAMGVPRANCSLQELDGSLAGSDDENTSFV